MGSFNGSGTFVRSYSWVTDAANGVNITASRFDTEDNGFASGLSNCITRDGQGGPVADIPWNGFALSNATISMLAGSQITDPGGVQRLVGYRNLPLSVKTAAYTIGLGDVGEGISITTGGVTIPLNSTTAFAIGDTVAVYNNSTSSQTITPFSGVTLRLGATTTTGSRTLAPYGLVVLLKVGTDEWVALNGGVT